ncbi:ferredoxin [Candidatus Ruthia magnifica str. Cm (Calyptogena magnifica)]|uniref:Ferredoxin n=1 Tax=Ruthia magnifica subsp. Calyptogena magnifica TaxID=413404 RepID=A1AWH2_RUTMC|nr:2Fe-2S iron-sulfur cluster-binding protein [Candidatus Ruthturnera calyptogenae]ABL02279.1 ferredoxin [Candidatus Ruthia magnifica str. Cm (Calyptogena magnifica)]
MFRIEVDNINSKTESLYVYGDRSILTELEQHNVFINHSCRQGYCGSCILQLLFGDVIHQDSFIPLSKGEILACRAIPVTNIKIGSRD